MGLSAAPKYGFVAMLVAEVRAWSVAPGAMSLTKMVPLQTKLRLVRLGLDYLFVAVALSLTFG